MAEIPPPLTPNLPGRLRLRTKLVLMLLLPAMGLAYFFATGLTQRLNELAQVQELESLAHMAVDVGQTVHELQKERGRTSLFLSSGGEEGFREALLQARGATDARLPVLQRALERFLDQPHPPAPLAEAREQLQELLQALPANRRAIDQQEMGIDTALDHYTTLDLALLELVALGSNQGHLSAFARRLEAYMAFVRAKDLAGLERARTGQALVRGGMDHPRLMALVRLHTAQEEYLNHFLRLSTPDEKALHHQTMAVPCVTEVLQMRTALLAHREGSPLPLDAPRWFDLSTCRIDQMKRVEDALVSRLRQLLQEQGEAVHWSLGSFLVFNLSSFLLTLFLIGLLFRQITRQTSRLLRGMELFASGRLSERIEVTSTDELGIIGQTFNHMAHRIEADTLAEQERSQREREEAARFRERVGLLQTAVAQVATGELKVEVPTDSDDELGRLASHLKGMIESLAGMARQTGEASRALAITLEQVQSAAQSQSSGASQQAAAVNQTTTTLQEIRATSGQTLEKAQAVGRMAERTRQEGENGHQSVEASLLAMEGIRAKVGTIATTILDLSRQTQRIGEITTAVTNLAQQSKMLALNASIEAAKAGEAGKGFAVVAEEVKSLADQSQHFTTQVHRILEEIRHASDKAVMATEEGSKEVDHGVRLMNQTGEAIRALSRVIGESSVASQQIVAAVRQEAAGIDQINTAMLEINNLTNQFVAVARQTAQATRDLGAVAEKLRANIRFYRV